MQTNINFISADKLVEVLKRPDILCDFSDGDKSYFFKKMADLLRLAEYEQDIVVRGGCGTGFRFTGFEREGVATRAVFEKRDTSYVENPEIAVIIPTIYRSLDFLARAVESCMRNTYKNFKIYITADGAENPSQFPECIARGIASGLIELNSLSHRGVYPKDPGKKWFIAGRDPLNYMIARANKKIICRLDDDDWYLENHFETIVAGYRALKGHGVVYTEPLTDSGNKPYSHPESWKKLGGSNQIFSCNVGYCGDVLNDFWYENQCDIPGDWHTYLQLIKKHKFLKIPISTSVHTSETQRRGESLQSTRAILSPEENHDAVDRRVLPDVTLVGFAFNDVKYLNELYAAYCTFSPWLKCNSTIIFSDISFDPSNYPEFSNVHFPNIGFLRSIKDYSNFVIKHLHKYYHTKHCLIFQGDGFPVNPKAWDSAFLAYDYIGAKWWHRDGLAGLNVGNGGFSLRSRALAEAASQLIPDGECHPEDHIICRVYGEQLRKMGFIFAPDSVADSFSVEWVGSYSGQFGFHSPHQFNNVLNWAMENCDLLQGKSVKNLMGYLKSQGPSETP